MKFASIVAVLVEYGLVVALKVSLCVLSNVLIAHFGDENVPSGQAACRVAFISSGLKKQIAGLAIPCLAWEPKY